MKILLNFIVCLIFGNNIYSQDVNHCKDRMIVVEKKLDSVFYNLIFEMTVSKPDASVKYKDMLCELIKIQPISDSIIIIEHYNFNTERITNNVYFINYMQGSNSVSKYTLNDTGFLILECFDSSAELLAMASKVDSIFDIKIITLIDRDRLSVTVFKGDK